MPLIGRLYEDHEWKHLYNRSGNLDLAEFSARLFIRRYLRENCFKLFWLEKRHPVILERTHRRSLRDHACDLSKYADAVLVKLAHGQIAKIRRTKRYHCRAPRRLRATKKYVRYWRSIPVFVQGIANRPQGGRGSRASNPLVLPAGWTLRLCLEREATQDIDCIDVINDGIDGVFLNRPSQFDERPRCQILKIVQLPRLNDIATVAREAVVEQDGDRRFGMAAGLCFSGMLTVRALLGYVGLNRRIEEPTEERA
jgi:hypothetical protein